MKYKFVSVFFSWWVTGHVKLTTKSSQIISVWRHFYSLHESWARRIEYINSLGRSSKINRAVTIFNFNWWIADSPVQITIQEIRPVTLMTRTVNFYPILCISFQAYLGERYYATVSQYYRSPCPDIFWGTASPKIFRGMAFPRVPHSPSTTPLATAVIFK